MTTTKPSSPEQDRRDRIRVPLRPPRGLLDRALVWYSRRVYGDVADPLLVMGHHRRLLLATLAFEGKVARWHALDDNLKVLAQTVSAGEIGCAWCLDFGYFLAQGEGVSLDKLREVGHWRESDVFAPVERDVMEYAAAMTATPPAVTDDLVERLLQRLGVPAVVELTKMVAVENERSRFNSALGLSSQGFSDRCELPPPAWTREGLQRG